MSFLWPRLLWLLFLIPALVIAYVVSQRKRKKYALRFASLAVVKEALGKGPGFRRHIPPILFITAMTVMLLALARPFTTIVLPSQRATIILTLDVSGSMRADDVSPNRIEAAQAAATAFVHKQPKNQRIGVVTFAESAAVVQAPTTNHDEVLAAIERLRTYRGTAIGRGILVSMDTILEEFGVEPLTPKADAPAGSSRDQGFGGGQDQGFGGGQDQGFGRGFDRRGGGPGQIREIGETENYPQAIVVLLSDGQSNSGPDPLDVADQVASLGVKIYTVGLGDPNGTVLHIFNRSVRVRLDEETLKRVAEKTGGSYFRAQTGTDLRGIYENLGTRLVFEPQRTEITAIFAAVAAALLMTAGALSLIWFSRLP